MALLILLKPRGAEEEAARGCGSYIVLELTVGVDEEEGRIADNTVFLKEFEVVVEMEPGIMEANELLEKATAENKAKGQSYNFTDQELIRLLADGTLVKTN